MRHARPVVGVFVALALTVLAPPPPLSSQTRVPATGGKPGGGPTAVTVPVTLDHNRMIVEVEFLRPDGSPRVVRAWVDTGNQDLILAEPLARDLGLDLSLLKAAEAGHSVALTTPAAGMRIGGMALDVAGVATRVRQGPHVMPGVPAEANLPASILRHYRVVLDYPARKLTVAMAGTQRPRGAAVPCRVNATTGLFMIAARINGETVQLGVDNGSAGTWVSESLTAAWQSRHPDWPHAVGALGSANFFGFPFEAAGVLMRLPGIGIGPLLARNVTVLGVDQGMFDWYSRKSAGAVAGFVGANVLREFRVEIDYPAATTYWERGTSPTSPDLDVVGLTLRPEDDGRFIVAGVASRNGSSTVEGVEPGDTLLRVDALATTNATMGAVVGALRGRPGTTHTLVIERAGKQLTVSASVTRFP